MTEEEQAGMIAGVEGIYEWHNKNPHQNHYFMENVAWGTMRHETIVKERLGEGKVLQGCAYGLKHQKPYRYWTSIPETVWKPRDEKVHCPACSQVPRAKHEQAMCPQKGDNRPRPHLPGYTNEAARNRVPPPLAEEVASAFVALREKMGEETPTALM